MNKHKIVIHTPVDDEYIPIVINGVVVAEQTHKDISEKPMA